MINAAQRGETAQCSSLATLAEIRLQAQQSTGVNRDNLKGRTYQGLCYGHSGVLQPEGLHSLVVHTYTLVKFDEGAGDYGLGLQLTLKFRTSTMVG